MNAIHGLAGGAHSLDEQLDELDWSRSLALLETALAGDASVSLVRDSLLDPERFRARLTDRCELTATASERTVTLDYPSAQDADSSSSASAVCLLRPVKGRALRGFVARGRTGAELRVLGRSETQVAVLRLLVEMLDELSQLADMASGIKFQLRQFLAGLVIMEPGCTTKAERDFFEAAVRERIGVLLRAEGACVDGSIDSQSDRSDWLATAASVAAGRDPVVVEVPSDDAGRVTYSQSDVYGSASISADLGFRQRVQSGLSRVASSIGALPVQVFLSSYKGQASGDYYLEVRVPPGNYVAEVKQGGVAVVTRGLGTGTAQIEGSNLRKRGAPGDGDPLQVKLKQRASGAHFRSLGVVVAVLLLAISVVGLELQPDLGASSSSGLEVLSWLTAVVSVALVGFWAIVVRTVEGMVFEVMPILLGLASSALLVVLASSLVSSGTWICPIVTALVAAFLSIWSAGTYITRLVQGVKLLSEDATRDLERAFV